MKYVVIISENKDADWNLSSMFKAKDSFSIELREKLYKTLEKFEGKYDRKNKMFVSDCGKKFKVFPDFSAKEID